MTLLKAHRFLVLSSIEIQVISETLRRATILPWFSRKAAADFEIDGMNQKMLFEQKYSFVVLNCFEFQDTKS